MLQHCNLARVAPNVNMPPRNRDDSKPEGGICNSSAIFAIFNPEKFC
jgi:hypothetical protein